MVEKSGEVVDLRRNGNHGKNGPNGLGQVTQQDKEQLKEFVTVRRWLKLDTDEQKAVDTMSNYLRYMAYFVRTTHQSPDEFLTWAKEQKDALDVMDRINSGAAKMPSEATRFEYKVTLRSFLSTNGFGRLPKSKLSYNLVAWHRAYRKQEVRKLLSFLPNKLHKLYVYVACETGFRADTILSIKYKHLMDDLKTGEAFVAVRLGPEFYNKPKSAGFTFLGPRCLALLRDCIKDKLIEEKPEQPIFPFKYPNVWKFLDDARSDAELDTKIAPSHGFRKYYEHGLDDAHLDQDVKMLLQGHFSGTRSKHYTEREWDVLRPEYQKAYPHLDIDTGDPELVKKLEGWQAEKAQLMEQMQNERQEWKRELAEMKEQMKELLLREKQKERPPDLDTAIRQLD